MTCIQKFHLLLLNTSNIFTWLLIYKKNAQISLRYHPEVTSKPIPLPSPPHPHLRQMSRRPNVVLYFKPVHTIWRNFWLKRPVRDTVIQFVWQNQNHWICIAVVLVTVIISFEKCFNCLLPKRSPRGGYSRIKVTGVLVGKFREHP